MGTAGSEDMYQETTEDVRKSDKTDTQLGGGTAGLTGWMGIGQSTSARVGVTRDWHGGPQQVRNAIFECYC